MGLAAFAAAVAMMGSAGAKPIIKEKTEYYSVSGSTGEDLLIDMNRRGPRHGFLRKAIAQTRYKTTPRGDLVHRDGNCRAVGGGVTVEITYIYPKPNRRLSPDLARRWRIFQADNIRHEKAHGRIARQMAEELDRKLNGFSMKDGPNCRRAFARVERDFGAILAKYEKMQNDFDQREHRDGGEVENSVWILVGTGVDKPALRSVGPSKGAERSSRTARSFPDNPGRPRG